MKSKAIIAFTVIFSAIILFNACGQQNTEWQGTIEKVDGILVIKNPKDPMYGQEILHLEEEISIGEAVGREEYMFSQINDIAVGNNGDIYVLDIKEHRVKVFDKHGEYIQTFGKGGEGPGEFIRPRIVVCTTHNTVAVGGMLRVSFFTSTGEFIDRMNPTALSLVQFNVDSQGNIIGLCMSISDKFTTIELIKVSLEVDEHLTYISVQKPRSGGDGIFPFGPTFSWELSSNDSVIWGYPADGYKLRVFNNEGKQSQIIQKEHSPESVTQNDIDRALKILDMPLDTQTSPPSEKPPYRKIFVDDAGRILVQIWDSVPSGEGFFYDIFDAEGKYISKVHMKFEPMLIKQGKLYTVIKDEDGFQYVKRYQVTWDY